MGTQPLAGVAGCGRAPGPAASRACRAARGVGRWRVWWLGSRYRQRGAAARRGVEQTRRGRQASCAARPAHPCARRRRRRTGEPDARQDARGHQEARRKGQAARVKRPHASGPPSAPGPPPAWLRRVCAARMHPPAGLAPGFGWARDTAARGIDGGVRLGPGGLFVVRRVGAAAGPSGHVAVVLDARDDEQFAPFAWWRRGAARVNAARTRRGAGGCRGGAGSRCAAAPGAPGAAARHAAMLPRRGAAYPCKSWRRLTPFITRSRP